MPEQPGPEHAGVELVDVESVVARLPMHRPWSIQSLITHVSLDRGRPIQIGPLPNQLAPYCTAVWIPRTNIDHIYVRENLSAMYEEVAIAHELGHILLAHSLSENEQKSYLKQMFPAVPPAFFPLLFGTSCTPLARSNYSHPFERQAEWFARLLLARADEYRADLLPDGRLATQKQQRILNRAAAVFGWP